MFESKIDVVKIARESSLFIVKSNFSRGNLIWLSEGLKFLDKIKNLIRQHTGDFFEVSSPAMYNQSLWKKSGHLNFFKENMFLGENGGLKPMNCPIHYLIYKDLRISDRSLPGTIFEFGQVHRKEPYGSINVPFRNMIFTQDDSHVFLKRHDILNEVRDFLQRSKDFYRKLNFTEFKILLSTSDSESLEVRSANQLLIDSNINFDSIEEGEGAFYGPKIELHLRDHLNRYGQCGTIQLDFTAAKTFDLDRSGDICVLHRAMIGSIERFLGLMLVNFEGFLPLRVHPEALSLNLFVPLPKRGNLIGFENIPIRSGLKDIREGIKESRRKRSLCCIFFGERERSLNRLKMNFLRNDKIYYLNLGEEERDLELVTLELIVERFNLKGA